MRLYLVRHGRPDVTPGICYGSADLAVVPQEHARVTEALLPLLPKQVPVISSPLRRCSELATRLAASLRSGNVRYDARLAEMNFGNWEMRTWDDIPRAEIDGWAADVTAYRPGGGESVLEVAQRVRSFHAELQSQNCESAVVVCHAGTIRLLAECQPLATPMEMSLNAARTRHAIAYGELVIVN
jgi:alpha-ribazole phosphatase